MHPQAYDFVKEWAPPHEVSVLEIGSCDVNGEVRHLFRGTYTGLDIAPGPGVDIVANAADYVPEEQYDVVVCTEVLEHTPQWREIVANIGNNMLKPAGVLILTCAGPGRAPHSARGGIFDPDEFYENVSPDDLTFEVIKWGNGYIGQKGEDTQEYVIIRI